MRITSGVRLCHSKPLFRRFKRQLENIRFELEGEASELETGVKDSIATQTCELSKEEFNDFLTLYPIPSEYHVILPKSNQTIFDALPGARLMVVSPLSTSSKGSSICVKLEPSPGFGTGSLSVLVNTEPLKADEELVIQPVKVTIDSRESLKPEVFVVHPGSVAARIKDRKCLQPPMLPVPRILLCKDDVPFLIVSDDDEGLPDNHLDNHMDVELLDLHDRCYPRQAVVDNAVNRRSRELLQVIEKLRGEFDVMKDMEWDRG
ncbi:hypothetical protein Tco_0157981 [Tanacetum coccineum]